MLTVTVAVNAQDVAWVEAQRMAHPRPLPLGTHAYRWQHYQRRKDQDGRLVCLSSGVLFHAETDGAVSLAAALLRLAVRE